MTHKTNPFGYIASISGCIVHLTLAWPCLIKFSIITIDLQVAPNGRVFFINHSEKKTTWVDPRTGRPSALPSQTNVPNRRHEDDLGPLPEGIGILPTCPVCERGIEVTLSTRKLRPNPHKHLVG